MAKQVRAIVDPETWAESGGTAGMFGKYWRAGVLQILTYQEHMERTNGTEDRVVIIDGVAH
jgi:hypothetical protein